MQSSSIRSEIQPAGGDGHDQVLSTPNEDRFENNSWQGEVESLEKLITAEKKFIETLPEMSNKHGSDMAELFSAFQKLKTAGKREVSEPRRMKKLVMHWRKRVSSAPTTDHNNNFIIKNNNIEENNSVFDTYMPPQKFHKSSFFVEHEALYKELGTELQKCLLCLAAFPENAEIKRRVLVQWWIGEGFVPPPTREDDEISNTHELDNRTAEDWGALYFHELINRGFLEPGRKGIGTDVNACRMHPLVYSVILKLAEDEKFFDIDLKEGSVTENYSSSLRSCLKMGKELTKLQDLKKLKTLFNVDETLLTLNPDWISKMKNAHVLHLGSWQDSASHQIEVLTEKSMNKNKYIDALDGLENVKQLRLLNLERFSRIRKLSSSISKLTDLTILNLRACHNLESLPNGIGGLVNLTHLDMSDCYLLEHMPKGIAWLTKIQVLQGFVVTNTDNKATCTLTDLRGCKELRKLGLHIKQGGFPSNSDLTSLNSLRALIKLKIAWGSPKGPSKTLINKKKSSLIERLSWGGYNKTDTQNIDLSEGCQKLPPQLKVLELVCLPFTSLPFWLMPCNLMCLERLFLTGGNLSYLPELTDFPEDLWKIEELHLKYIDNLEIEWGELCEQFPALKYLKMVNCPKLSFFPCDVNGIWMR